MRRLRSRLPPVSALVSFEAAARHLSFTKAAVELGVTREAVSRQIRLLESHLGLKLFVRLHRSVELSREGHRFSQTVHESLEAIANCATSFGERVHTPKVTLSSTVAIASFWLTPRLPRFRQHHPRTEIRVVVSDAPLDMTRDNIDVGLRYGDGDWPGVRATRLFGCESFPVCSPAYLEAAPVITYEAQLLQHTLLNLDGPLHQTEDWIWWLEQGAENPIDGSAMDIVGFDNYANVLQAALDGQGIALGFSGIIDGLLADGRLLRPLQAGRDPGHSVYVVRRANPHPPPAALEFHDWVLREAGVNV